MIDVSYDNSSPKSILEFAKNLSGKTLAEAADLSELVENIANKGDLGGMVEKYYFKHTPPNNHEPDFAEAGVELKTTGVKRVKSGYVAKERLVLSMINYMKLVDEDWSSSSLMNKCRLMLLLFYLYEKGVPVFNRRFVYKPLLWDFPEADLKIIENDWKLIQKKIKDGKAHELSEGDTYYLGACRKGTGGPKEKPLRQPYSDVPAKSRAFSLKPSYMNTILANHAEEAELLKGEEVYEIDKVTLDKLSPYLGLSISEICQLVSMENRSQYSKAFYKSLTMRMLGTEKRELPEFEKAGIEIKTVRLSPNGRPKESMSFPAFSYLGIIDEDWEDSAFFNKLEKKFLFIVFRMTEKGLIFEKAQFWNMPYSDRKEAKRVWEKTKQRVISNNAENLPRTADSAVAHVRPHGRNALDTLPTPDGKQLPKKGFWLNSGYIAEQLAKV